MARLFHSRLTGVQNHRVRIDVPAKSVYALIIVGSCTGLPTLTTGPTPASWGNDAMQSQKFSEIAEKSRFLIEACKQNLARLDEQLAKCTASPEESLHPAFGLDSKIEPVRVQLCRESAKETRAFSEETNDPEIKRLLLDLADSYDRMAKWGVAEGANGATADRYRARAA